VACTPMSEGSATACPAPVTAECSRADMLAAIVEEELAEGLSAFVPSILPLPAFGLPATAGPCATLLGAEPVDVAVADGSAVPGAVSGSLDAAVPACAMPAALGATFGTTDAVAATAVVNSAPVAAVASVCVADRLTVVAAVSLAAWTLTFAVAAAFAVVALAAADAVAAVALASILVCAVDATGASVAAELAAIAAAAIASGSVALPDAGEAVGTSAAATLTGIATATGFGVVTGGLSCWAGAAGSAAEGASAWAAEASSEIDFAVDLVSSVFEVPDLALERWMASVFASVLASERCLIAASRSSESFCAALSAEAALRDCLRSAAADASSERRRDAVCSCAVEFARSLLVSAAVLLSTNAPKLSFPGDWSERAGLGGGAP